jgi:hypothetical protein
MEFGIYLQRLAEQLGEAQLPVNVRWQRAAQIVREDAVHYALMKRVVAGLYKRGHCSKPSDPLTLDLILDYLGEMHYELNNQPGNDLDAMALLERIGEISIALFGSDQTRDEPTVPFQPRHGRRHVTPRAAN